MIALPEEINSLKKLQAFGRIGEDEKCEFEWPKFEDLQNMPADVKVSKIVIKEDPNTISYIKLIMSDGTESPEFMTQGGRKDNEKIVELDEANRPVKAIKGLDKGSA